jgi:hypothetical protein
MQTNHKRKGFQRRQPSRLPPRKFATGNQIGRDKSGTEIWRVKEDDEENEGKHKAPWDSVTLCSPSLDIALRSLVAFPPPPPLCAPQQHHTTSDLALNPRLPVFPLKGPCSHLLPTHVPMFLCSHDFPIHSPCSHVPMIFLFIAHAPMFPCSHHFLLHGPCSHDFLLHGPYSHVPMTSYCMVHVPMFP